jgi:hypothetical protein
MAGQDSKLADVISVLNNALQVALLLVERDPAIQHAGADAAQIRDAVFRAATAAHDLWLMTHTEGGRDSPVWGTARDAEVPSRGKDTARKVGAGAAVGLSEASLRAQRVRSRAPRSAQVAPRSTNWPRIEENRRLV